jgi:hypothetical protein
MNLRPSQPHALTELYWSGSVLNSYTIALLIASPFWSGLMLAKGQGLAVLVMWVALGGMIALSVIEKPLFAYDPVRKMFVAPDGQEIPLSDIHSIEMDARDIYFIPKSHTIEGWHLSQRVWVLSPRRVLKKAAADYNWPLKDITHAVLRFGFWIAP